MKSSAVLLCGVLGAGSVAWCVYGPTPSQSKSSLKPVSAHTQTPVRVAHKPVLPETAAEPETVADEGQPVRLSDVVARLERGRRWLETVPDYTATFHRHERVNGALRDPETTALKLRHQPFSVTMVWTSDGKTVHYRDGHNSNRVAVRLGGWKRRLGWINLNPHSSLAMEQSRYAITDVGLMRLTEQLLQKYEPYLEAEGVVCAWLPDEAIGGRPCRVFHVEYASADVNPEYRLSTVWLDREWNVPLSVRNTDWLNEPENPEGLIEYYVYEDLKLDRQLTDRDFTVDALPDTNVAAAAE